MFENRFAKYARAISDEAERKWLYKKYVAKNIALIIFYALCLIFIVAAIALDDRLEVTDIVLIALFSAWVISGIVTLCLWLTFKRAYKAIINRPATQGETPEVTAYRQKVVQDKRSNFKKLWWAWLVFGVCVVAFIACMVMEAIENPDGDYLTVWGNIGFWVLLAGALTLVLAYILNSALKQQQGKLFEQQTAQEAEVIDRAQGRKVKYNILSDVNAREEKMYEYLFPNTELRAEANRERKRRTKIIIVGSIIITVIAAAAFVLLICSEYLFGKNIFAYACPVVLTVVFGGIIILSLATGGRLKAIEKRQNAELEANPTYAKNLEWYRLYKGFYKFKGRIILIFVAAGIALSWVLCVIFPSSWWSVLSVVPMVVGLALNNIFVKDMRKKALVIEREIDEQRQSGGQLTICEGGEE